MESVRKPYQGVANIVKFNWHFYLIAFIFILFLSISEAYINEPFRTLAVIAVCLIALSLLISLLVSFYIYDISGLYRLKWLKKNDSKLKIVNINAGFDETSALLKSHYPNGELIVLDFYDPKKHTEVSIKRARKAYPPFAGTIKTGTNHINLEENSTNKIFLFLSAHEIRNAEERAYFFRELRRILKPDGEIIVTEHLQNTANFLAYNIGFLHFHSKKTWVQTFEAADLQLKEEQKITPFISNFILNKYGTAS